METLLSPDKGLIFWTIINFLLLAFLLGKFAWRPIIAALDAREKAVAADIAKAASASEDAQKIKQDLQNQMDALSKESLTKIKEAAALGEQEKQKILAAASAQAMEALKQAREQIQSDTAKAMSDFRAQAAALTAEATKRIIAKEADQATTAKLVDELLEEVSPK